MLTNLAGMRIAETLGCDATSLIADTEKNLKEIRSSQPKTS